MDKEGEQATNTAKKQRYQPEHAFIEDVFLQGVLETVFPVHHP
jgi:hypothetical protein